MQESTGVRTKASGGARRLREQRTASATRIRRRTMQRHRGRKDRAERARPGHHSRESGENSSSYQRGAQRVRSRAGFDSSPRVMVSRIARNGRRRGFVQPLAARRSLMIALRDERCAMSRQQRACRTGIGDEGGDQRRQRIEKRVSDPNISGDGTPATPSSRERRAQCAMRGRRDDGEQRQHRQRTRWRREECRCRTNARRSLAPHDAEPAGLRASSVQDCRCCSMCSDK